MARVDIVGDARRAVDAVKAGGVVIFPTDVGYAGMGGCETALTRLFRAKGRAAHKRNAMIGNPDLQREIHRVDNRAREVLAALIEDFDLPISVIAPYREDHPLLRQLGEQALAASTEGGTVAMLLNVGPLEAEISRLAASEGQALFGSSANLTGTGTRFRVEDIQPEILSVAECVIDYGLQKYHSYKRSSTMIDIMTMEVVRIGACYEVIRDVLQRHFAIELPPDPGVDALPSGHLREAQRRYL